MKKSNITFVRKVKEKKPKKIKQRTKSIRKTEETTKNNKETKQSVSKRHYLYPITTAEGYVFLETAPNSSHAKREKLREHRNKKYSEAIEKCNNGEITPCEKNELCRGYSRDYKMGVAKLEDKEARKNRKAFGTKRPLNFTFAKNQQNGINMNNNLNINKK